MNRNGILTCPRCGRVLMGAQPCPNCTPVGGGYASYSAESYGYTAQSNAPRWLLLAGALLLLGLLIAAVSLRQSATVLGTSEQPAGDLAAAPTPAWTTLGTRPTPESAEERAFWRRKTERELREVGEYHPTEEEKAAQEAMRWQDHAALSDQSRTTDFYMRRPELVGGGADDVLMDINLTTPALLFPAISLLMLAYTNRFLAIANLIRNLYATSRTQPNEGIPAQIANLRHRIRLIQMMQALGVVSALLGVLCMFVLFQGWATAGKVAFGGSLVTLMGSLLLSLREIQVSVNALNVQLSDMETGAVLAADEKRPAGQEHPAGPL